MLKPGDIVLAKVHFTDTFEVKQRPALVLYEEFGNVVVAGITSNTKMKGIPLGKKDGMMKESVIKLNYIFTLSSDAIVRSLAYLDKEKRREVHRGLTKMLSKLED